MPTGTLIKLLHLSQQRYVPGTRLVADHNDKGYGIIEDDGGRQVYFSHEAVTFRNGFDNLRKGQRLDYTLENEPFLQATFVQVTAAAPANTVRPAAKPAARWRY